MDDVLKARYPYDFNIYAREKVYGENNYHEMEAINSQYNKKHDFIQCNPEKQSYSK